MDKLVSNILHNLRRILYKDIILVKFLCLFFYEYCDCKII